MWKFKGNEIGDTFIRLFPTVFLADMFPEWPPDPANAIKLMPGTALNGAPNTSSCSSSSALWQHPRISACRAKMAAASVALG
jgi:hypothetical protein